ncbi:kinase-like domain, phloem protein 2-like protein [Tanacetum coccineum]
MMMSSVNHDDLTHLKIPLESILTATNNFADKNLRGGGGFRNHYAGQLLWSGELIDIHARSFTKDEWDDEKEQQFWMEISLLSSLKHKNLVPLVGFCDENDEKIIIIKLETERSLENYLIDSTRLTWVRRLEISVLLNDIWESKLSEFRLSMKIEASQRHRSFCVNKVRDIEGKSIIANDTNKYLAPVAITHYREKKLHEIIDWDLWEQMDSQAFDIFTKTAYDCLNEERSHRPNIDEIVTILEKALELQLEHQKAVTRFFLFHLSIIISTATLNLFECIPSFDQFTV